MIEWISCEFALMQQARCESGPRADSRREDAEAQICILSRIRLRRRGGSLPISSRRSACS